MKRNLLSLAVAIVAIAAAGANAQAQDFTVGNLKYTIDDGSANVSGYVEGITDAVIPATVKHESTTYPVKEINAMAFNTCKTLTSVTIEEGNMTQIGMAVFDNCSKLETVTLCSTVNYVGQKAFDGCTALKTITCHAVNTPWAMYNTFARITPADITMFVPVGSVEAYKAHEVWGLCNVQPIKGTETGIGAPALTPSATDVRKVLRNGQVLIERNGKTYTLTGVEVK